MVPKVDSKDPSQGAGSNPARLICYDHPGQPLARRYNACSRACDSRAALGSIPPRPSLVAAAAQPQPAASPSCSVFRGSILLLFLGSSKLGPTGTPVSCLAISGPFSSQWQPSLSVIWCSSPNPALKKPELTLSYCTAEVTLHSVAVHKVPSPWIQTAGQGWLSTQLFSSSGSVFIPYLKFCMERTNSRPTSLSSYLTHESWGLIHVQQANESALDCHWVIYVSWISKRLHGAHPGEWQHVNILFRWLYDLLWC